MPISPRPHFTTSTWAAQCSLGGAVFDDVNLSGASFHNINLSNVRIADVNIDGMTIDGVLVMDLFAAYRRQ